MPREEPNPLPGKTFSACSSAEITSTVSKWPYIFFRSSSGRLSMPVDPLPSDDAICRSVIGRGSGGSSVAVGEDEGKRLASSSIESMVRLSSVSIDTRCAFWSLKATRGVAGAGDCSWRAERCSPATMVGPFGLLISLNESVDAVRVSDVEKGWKRTLILF